MKEAYYVADAANPTVSKALCGLAHVTYLAPQDLVMPVLYHERKSDSSIVYAACRTCANGLTQKHCAHRVDRQKRMTAVVCTPELALARKLKYRSVVSIRASARLCDFNLNHSVHLSRL